MLKIEIHLRKLGIYLRRGDSHFSFDFDFVVSVNKASPC